jgi:hypothetical protein
MRVKMLRNVGKNLPDLVPDSEKGDKATAAALAQRAGELPEGEVVEVADKEGEFLTKHGLAHTTNEEPAKKAAPAPTPAHAAGATRPAPAHRAPEPKGEGK